MPCSVLLHIHGVVRAGFHRTAGIPQVDQFDFLGRFASGSAGGVEELLNVGDGPRPQPVEMEVVA